MILVGDNPGSVAFIKQKQKAATRIGADLILKQLPETASPSDVSALVTQYNNDPKIHGLIVQRPLPPSLGDMSAVLASVALNKDVDGFLPNSPFIAPVARAVLAILNLVFEREKPNIKETTFDEWLQNQCSVIIGRGETAGKPISKVLTEKGCTISIVHSHTPNPKEITLKFNIIVSCVGRERVVTPDMVTPQTILIGVGMWTDPSGKLRGDFNKEEIDDNVAYYTPTPGGVGPVNVANLMKNLVEACILTSGKPS
ncbi:bifunctional 5,10-methylenetetrahydrofolate dehydrogenase/5,10-methenyltetrahydrofolate cyclohydrolase [Candidatus Gottesmanbacteria bacterium]|nr:bifunctional 5,10-methylenetetrahydrofolate dehydrogenase/5,10-methenyltetrahydrofolate cyclohydrolase [Candidatus Gottesmanbacteria bacterium]